MKQTRLGVYHMTAGGCMTAGGWWRIVVDNGLRSRGRSAWSLSTWDEYRTI